MAIQATVSLQVAVTGLPAGISIDIDHSEEISPAIGQIQLLNLTSTLAAVTVPTGAAFMIIVPPSGSTEEIEIAGANVAGATLHTTRPALIPLKSSSPTVYLGTESSNVDGVTVIFI